MVLLLMIIAGIWAFFTFSQNEEKKVKKQFQLLSERISKEPSESIFSMESKAKDIGSLFDDPCIMKIQNHSLSGTYSREEVIRFAAEARLHLSQLQLNLYDFVISFPEKGKAKVRLTVRATGRTTTGENIDETHELDCLLKKTEREWRFNTIEVIEVLKK